MSAVNLPASLPQTALSPEPRRDARPHSTAGLSFASVLSKLDGQGGKAGESKDAVDATANVDGTASTASQATVLPINAPQSIEAGLAALGYGVGTPLPQAEAPRTNAAAPAVNSGSPRVAAAKVAASSSTAATTSDPAPTAASTDVSIDSADSDLLTGDPMLGFQGLTARSFLDVTGSIAAPTRVKAQRPPATPSPSKAPAVDPRSGAAQSVAVVATPSEAAKSSAAEDNDSSRNAASAVGAADATAAADPAPLAPDPALGATAPAVALSPIKIGQLADVVAEQAATLTAPSAAASKAANPARAVKELEISLDPADLGAVSIKMRMENGKLSVVIAVSNSTTLAAIEGERGAIADRLGSAQQPLDDLVIRSGDNAGANSEGNDAPDANASRQSKSNGGDRPDARGQGEPSANRWANASPNRLGGGSDALRV